MLEVRFVIWGRKRRNADGETEAVELFRWCRDEASGIARAKQDAAEWGDIYEAFWARPV